MSVYLTLYVFDRSDLASHLIEIDCRNVRFPIPQNCDILSQFSGVKGCFPEYPAPIIKTVEMKSIISMEGEIKGTDCWGGSWRYCNAKEISKLNLFNEKSFGLRALKAYAKELPKNTPFLLEWR